MPDTVGLHPLGYGRFANGEFVWGEMMQVEGGPAWVNTDLYEIIAKAQGTPRPGVMAGL